MTATRWNPPVSSSAHGPGDAVARYYDPETGRFTTRDPIGIWGSVRQRGNGYGAFGNSPFVRRDVFGLDDMFAGFSDEELSNVARMPLNQWSPDAQNMIAWSLAHPGQTQSQPSQYSGGSFTSSSTTDAGPQTGPVSTGSGGTGLEKAVELVTGYSGESANAPTLVTDHGYAEPDSIISQRSQVVPAIGAGTGLFMAAVLANLAASFGAEYAKFFAPAELAPRGSGTLGNTEGLALGRWGNWQRFMSHCHATESLHLSYGPQGIGDIVFAGLDDLKGQALVDAIKDRSLQAMNAFGSLNFDLAEMETAGASFGQPGFFARWELETILATDSLLNKSTFYLNGEKVSSDVARALLAKAR